MYQEGSGLCQRAHEKLENQKIYFETHRWIISPYLQYIYIILHRMIYAYLLLKLFLKHLAN